MDAMRTCRPNDDESRNLQTTQNSGNVVEETVKEINEKKLFLYIQCPEPKTNLKKERVMINMECFGRLCNEVCNLNLDIKDEITKVIKLGTK